MNVETLFQFGVPTGLLLLFSYGAWTVLQRFLASYEATSKATVEVLGRISVELVELKGELRELRRDVGAAGEDSGDIEPMKAVRG